MEAVDNPAEVFDAEVFEAVHPEVAGPRAGEQMAALVLRMPGLTPQEADEVARRPLPPAP
ncbi:hypothetical protein [Streptomyces resistomycificus]|uniref:Uncharacterized protein n=1 Tax=Streptomyces resistomycificus TaxID=67356 RepID=A0A0L8LA99_9ACTN|nr:hypothetical protein [Streptomyces resistomycificus]KOG35062.1 hypothetical protein ADK37_16940 [Streptomyces resistomycificus]KUN97749.1 hypothetical protein AQJ84_16705 [Streptomyces resistomycificus]